MPKKRQEIKKKKEPGERFLAEALRQAPVPVLITDVSGKIVYVNATFTRLTGYRYSDLKGKKPSLLSAGKTPAEVYQDMWASIASGGAWQGELLNKRKNGEEYWETISIGTVRGKANRVTHYVGVWQDSTRRKRDLENIKRQSRHLEKQSITDELTGVHNRRFILSEVAKEMDRARRYGRALSGMMIDIDGFKKVNDDCGHVLGDRVLRSFAAILKKSLRKADIVGRYGGDEFLVILPETDLEAGFRTARRVQENFALYNRSVMTELASLTVSIGLFSAGISAEETPEGLIARIDTALLKAKKNGKNQIVVAPAEAG
ncbi:MAG TPA: diguanylate cyclase [Verrucomicrobiae bacterium]|nr:diguanylate cyclase [Verrucomicrobiae bacterium]